MRQVSILLLTAFVMGLVGCGDNPTVPSREPEVQPAPLTVSPEIRDLLEHHADLSAEELPELPDSRSSVPEPSNEDYDVYAVVFLWGQLANVPVESNLSTDWSGKLSANAEVLINVRHVIDFEPGQDSLIPVSTPDHIEWPKAAGPRHFWQLPETRWEYRYISLGPDGNRLPVPTGLGNRLRRGDPQPAFSLGCRPENDPS